MVVVCLRIICSVEEQSQPNLTCGESSGGARGCQGCWHPLTRYPAPARMQGAPWPGTRTSKNCGISAVSLVTRFFKAEEEWREKGEQDKSKERKSKGPGGRITNVRMILRRRWHHKLNVIRFR